MTKKENFGALRYIVENFVNDEIFADGGTFASTDKNGLLSFIDHEVELLSRKRSASSKPTKRQMENEAIKAHILDVLANGEMTATEVMKELDEGLSLPRVTALLTQLVGNGVHREKVKGKAMFSLA